MVTPFDILGLDHVVLRVSDRDRMVRFYRDVLGCSVEKVQDDFGLVQLRAGRCLIDLLDRGEPAVGTERGPESVNMDHFCVTIDPFDADALTAHLSRHGAAPGEVAVRYGASGYGPSVYLSDPEGNMIELKSPPEAGN